MAEKEEEKEDDVHAGNSTAADGCGMAEFKPDNQEELESHDQEQIGLDVEPDVQEDVEQMVPTIMKEDVDQPTEEDGEEHEGASEEPVRDKKETEEAAAEQLRNHLMPLKEAEDHENSCDDALKDQTEHEHELARLSPTQLRISPQAKMLKKRRGSMIMNRGKKEVCCL